MNKRSHYPEVADVIRAYGAHFRKKHKLAMHHHKVLNALAQCRTSALGGHVDACDSCGHERISYNSCRNRHCPKCGSLARERWITARQDELLPVSYFHVVFTVPDELNHLVQMNTRLLYTLLFRTVSETLQTLSRDPKHLGAEIGMICILHTWGQNLMNHPHIHCIIPGGGLSSDGRRWISSRKDFFLPVKVLSRMFRGKLLHHLKGAYQKGALQYAGTQMKFSRGIDALYKREWVVYAKEPFGGPQQVLAYLGRYTHRVAISNDRIVSITDGRVTFRWRDYRDVGKTKLMMLDAAEFIRRFLLHVLPRGLCKIRYYGIMSNRKRKSSLARCRELLGGSGIVRACCDVIASQWIELLLKLTGIDIRVCPECNKGKMALRRMLLPIQALAP
jgi:hypothetical protein